MTNVVIVASLSNWVIWTDCPLNIQNLGPRMFQRAKKTLPKQLIQCNSRIKKTRTSSHRTNAPPPCDSVILVEEVDREHTCNYCWWFKIPAANHLKNLQKKKTLENSGINYISYQSHVVIYPPNLWIIKNILAAGCTASFLAKFSGSDRDFNRFLAILQWWPFWDC